MAREQAVNDNDDADDWERYERETNSRPGEELSEGSADLSADGCAGMHDECYENIHIAFKGMCNRPISSGNDNFEKIGSDSDVGRDAKQVMRQGMRM